MNPNSTSAWVAIAISLLLMLGALIAWSIHMIAENKDLKMEIGRLKEKLKEKQ